MLPWHRLRGQNGAKVQVQISRAPLFSKIVGLWISPGNLLITFKVAPCHRWISTTLSAPVHMDRLQQLAIALPCHCANRAPAETVPRCYRGRVARCLPRGDAGLARWHGGAEKEGFENIYWVKRKSNLLLTYLRVKRCQPSQATLLCHLGPRNGHSRRGASFLGVGGRHPRGPRSGPNLPGRGFFPPGMSCRFVRTAGTGGPAASGRRGGTPVD